MEKEMHIKSEPVWLREYELVLEDEINEYDPMSHVWMKPEVFVKQEANDLGAEIKRKLTSYLEKDLTSSNLYKEVEGGVEESKEEMKNLEDVKSVFLLNDAVQEQEPSTSVARVPLDTMRMKSLLKQNMLLDKNCDISKKPSDIQNPVYRCEICDMEFAKTCQLQAHIILHGDQNIQCNICFKRYVYKRNLYKHIRLVHEGREKIRCFCCRRKFVTFSGLRKHLIIVHIGESNFKCSMCNNSYSDFSSVYTHLLEHMKGT